MCMEFDSLDHESCFVYMGQTLGWELDNHEIHF